MSSSTCAQSPMIGMSTLTFLLIDDGSMSTWILLRARRERVEPAGDAVVEARADADHHVAVVHRPVRLPGAVHAEHAEPLRIGGRIGAEPHQRRGDRKAGELDQLAQEVARLRAGIDDAAAGVEQRPLGVRHQLDRGLDAVEVALDLRPVALVLEFGRLGIDARGELHVLRDVDHHRARPAARGDVERLVQHARQVGDALHQIVVLGAGPRDADGVAFLEGVVADQVGRHLPGDARPAGSNRTSASVRPVTALVAPGPEVTSTQPTLPVERA